MLDLEYRAAPFARPRPAFPPSPRVCVIFATRGRPALVDAAVTAMDRQTLRPSSLVISCPERADAGAAGDRPGVTLVTGARGLAAQRNAGLRHVPPGTEFVVFFDDDFVPRRDWIAAAVTVFGRSPDIGAVTGTLLADGIKGPGITVAEARRLLKARRVPGMGSVEDGYTPYGCNMAFRASAIAERSFDERLVLYGWLEDRDFGAALQRRGYRIVRIDTALGVHLGVKVGRVSGRRLGYSQVVNPLYLWRKGTMPLQAVADHLFRNIVSNLARAIAPEPFIDRRGRLEGNLRALRDIARGTLRPELAAEL
jgi:GT2 family glycosyltransferase